MEGKLGKPQSIRIDFGLWKNHEASPLGIHSIFLGT